MTVVFEDAVFFFCDVDLQAKRECSDDISSAVCALNTELITKIENERLHAPAALAEYFHYSIWLIPFAEARESIPLRGILNKILQRSNPPVRPAKKQQRLPLKNFGTIHFRKKNSVVASHL